MSKEVMNMSLSMTQFWLIAIEYVIEYDTILADRHSASSAC